MDSYLHNPRTEWVKEIPFDILNAAVPFTDVRNNGQLHLMPRAMVESMDLQDDDQIVGYTQSIYQLPEDFDWKYHMLCRSTWTRSSEHHIVRHRISHAYELAFATDQASSACTAELKCECVGDNLKLIREFVAGLYPYVIDPPDNEDYITTLTDLALFALQAQTLNGWSGEDVLLCLQDDGEELEISAITAYKPKDREFPTLRIRHGHDLLGTETEKK